MNTLNKSKILKNNDNSNAEKGLFVRSSLKNYLNSSNATLINVSQSLCQGDRLIPRRDDERFDYGNYSITNRPKQKISNSESNANSNEPSTPPNFLDENDENLVLKNFIRGKPDEELEEVEKIWTFTGISVPQAPVGHMSRQKVVHSGILKPSSSMKKAVKKRCYPASELRILDAPNLLDDYYSTPIHWGFNNQIAVALTFDIYAYVPVSGESYHLYSIDEGPDFISSVQYSNSAQFLSVALSDGKIYIIDVETRRRMRTMRSQVGRIACQAWNHNTLSVGTRSGNLYHHDVRMKDHKISSHCAHTEEICGLLWSPDKKYLVSSSGDCNVQVWGGDTVYSSPESSQKTLIGHTGTVKALSFVPNSYYEDVLATGGGTSDGTIKLWNIDNGTIIKEVETHSPVNGIFASDDYKEIVSFHGNPSNNMNIWNSGSLKQLHSFEPYRERIISHTVSPGNEYVVTASADQTVKIWELFPYKHNNKKEFEFVGRPRQHNVHPTHRIR
ncbi:Cell division cycle protein 20 homolog [Strongyloides ratti]|uniref:Cell division cycle protein 20 homolog n=1 Tax=Strongyloides ratti TaxID=34506 RepID=A0A090L4S7_STRRB|nr:Cell division cycle protein 20 homolog [Strongyloides ratti]CEF64692.1 Cell division cycle protein 20 homolog [Strongyloides ratti]